MNHFVDDDKTETRVFSKPSKNNSPTSLGESSNKLGTNTSAPILRSTIKSMDIKKEETRKPLKKTTSAPYLTNSDYNLRDNQNNHENIASQSMKSMNSMKSYAQETLRFPKRNLSDLSKKEKHLDLIAKEKRIRTQIIEDNNGWNTDLEIIVANIGEKAGGFKWMHAKAMSYYAIWYHVFGVSSILLSGAAGTTILTQINSCSINPITNQPAQNWVLILVGIVMYLTAVVASIQQFKNWGQRSEKHQQAESKYAELEHDIRIMLGNSLNRRFLTTFF